MSLPPPCLSSPPPSFSSFSPPFLIHLFHSPSSHFSSSHSSFPTSFSLPPSPSLFLDTVPFSQLYCGVHWSCQRTRRCPCTAGSEYKTWGFHIKVSTSLIVQSHSQSNHLWNETSWNQEHRMTSFFLLQKKWCCHVLLMNTWMNRLTPMLFSVSCVSFVSVYRTSVAIWKKSQWLVTSYRGHVA